MKKIILLVLLISNLTFSQESFNATYGLQFDFEKSSEDKSNKNTIVEKYKNIAARNSKGIKFILKGNNSQSEFSLEKTLANEEKEVKIALALAGYFGQNIYLDAESNTMIKKSPNNSRLTKDDEFLIKNTLFNDWKLLNESKTIQGYECFKAVGTITNENESKKFLNVTAWYCPSINFSYGPLGYGNLPGLIILLKVEDVIYTLKEVQFPDKDIKIDLPIKGKVVTQIEFNEILKERRKALERK